MDIKNAASQLMTALANNPDLVAQLSQHPYSTTAKVMGTDENISQKDMSRILTQLAASATGQSLDTSSTKDLASALLGQSGGSVHSLASALFGGMTQNAGAAGSGTAGALDLSSVLGALNTSGSAAGTGSTAGPSMAEIAAKSIAGGIAARGLAALITGAMSASKNNAASK